MYEGKKVKRMWDPSIKEIKDNRKFIIIFHTVAIVQYQ